MCRRVVEKMLHTCRCNKIGALWKAQQNHEIINQQNIVSTIDCAVLYRIIICMYDLLVKTFLIA